MSLQDSKPRKIDRKRPSRQIDDQEDNLQSMQQQQLPRQRQSQLEPYSRPIRKDRFPSSQTGDQQHYLEPTQQQRQRMQLPTLQISMQGDDDQQDNNLQPMQQWQQPTQRERGSSHAQPPYEARRWQHKNSGLSPKDLAVWFVGACCALMWTIVILGGVVVLIVYLVFRPKSPLLDIQSATLNAAYLDTGTLLNADITILANFSNPNRKVHVAFSYVQVDLYFMDTMIATQAVEPFAERPGESALKSLHVIASEVPLPRKAAEEWQRGTSEEGVALEVTGRFRTRSDLGKWLHFTYWLYGHCTIVIGAPPTGVLLSSRCRTKR
ncbi:uncharacterized protein [Elaeis guineensis]|uniref:Uncharacterized protein LOC105053306 n=1 Tax=Elaeis guineensis var. tenera TaxID=51953 RepID=A0A6I9RVU5_ELAGV|nr:uncharacterized protein LOC105053306 [Elaeis guineensis]